LSEVIRSLTHSRQSHAAAWRQPATPAFQASSEPMHRPPYVGIVGALTVMPRARIVARKIDRRQSAHSRSNL